MQTYRRDCRNDQHTGSIEQVTLVQFTDITMMHPFLCHEPCSVPLPDGETAAASIIGHFLMIEVEMSVMEEVDRRCQAK